MTHFYSPSTNGFYHPAAHGPRKLPKKRLDGNYDFVDNSDCKIPVDAVEINDELYRSLILGQCDGGKRIVAGRGGIPELQDRPPAD